MEKELLSNLVQHVTALGSSVGFAPEGPAAPVEETNPPGETLIWTSSFAVVALVPVFGLISEALRSTAHDAQEWLWRRITLEEEKARFLDGYLLLALPTAPIDALRGEVREIELETSVCRKHVIWPDADGGWTQKLWAVTCLGLPEIQHSIPTGLIIPTLPAAATRAVKCRDAGKNYEEVADKLREEARLAATKTN